MIDIYLILRDLGYSASQISDMQDWILIDGYMHSQGKGYSAIDVANDKKYSLRVS